MEIKNMNLEEVLARKSAIKDELQNDSLTLEAINGFETEINELNERKKELDATEEQRKLAIEKVSTMTDGVILEQRMVGEENMTKDVFTIESKEYRSAFLNKIRDIELNEVEARAFTTAVGSAEAVIPKTTQNKVLEVIKQHAPLLAEINLLKVPGSVRIPVEDVVNAAVKHAENASITAAADKLKYVDLFGYEVVKLLQVSKSVTKMSIDAFEDWLATNLGKSLAAFIVNSIIAGTGTGEATGIDTITWGAANSITVAKTDALKAKDVTDLIALLPGGYDANAKFLMSKKTLFTDFMPLKDASKHDLVTREGNSYFIYGYPVLLDERITINEAILGDFAQYYGNMPEDVNVTPGFDLNTNSYKFLGSAMFDGKPAIEAAFVKLVKATE